MKQIRILLAISFLMCAAPAFCSVAINATNFPDAIFRDYIVNELGADVDGNGVLDDTEIASVKIMRVWGRYIADLSGIEYFTALEELYCYDNELDALDVSRNSELLLLECDNNRLSRLDVSRNAKLMNLECEANSLAELDVSSNYALSYVKCYSQIIGAADDYDRGVIDLSGYVSDLGKITDLTCYDSADNVISNISFDMASGVVTLTPEAARIVYGYNIGYLKDSSLSMDVTISRTGSGYDVPGPGSTDSCGHGCNSGSFGIFTLLMIALLFRFVPSRSKIQA